MRTFREPLAAAAARPLIKQRDIQVPAESPFAFDDVFQPGGDEHRRRAPVWEGAEHYRWNVSRPYDDSAAPIAPA